MKEPIFLPHYEAASPETREAGMEWYEKARVLIGRWARTYRVPKWYVAGVVSLLSQRKQWSKNLLQTEKFLQGHDPDTFPVVRIKLERLIGLRYQLHPDEEYLEPSNLLGIVWGPKIRAFYRALRRDDNAVVLDTWMLKATETPRPTARQYEKIADILRREAASVGVSPAQFQAVVWCQLRGRSE